MKKLFTLLTLALFAVSGAWAGEETATWTFETDASGLTLTPSGSATITRDQYSSTGSSWGSSSGSYCLYGNLGSTKGSSATITTNSSYNKISKISLLLGTTDRGKTEFALQVSPNSDFSSDVTNIQAQVTIKDNITSVTSNTTMYTVSYNIGTPVSGYVRIVIAQASGSNNKKMLVDDLKITYDAGAVDPVFSLTKTTIGTDETSQIQVGSKGDLDGLTMKSLTYDDSKISINADGLVTPLVAGGPYSITFTTDAVADKYNAGSADLSITVTAPKCATPVITPDSKVFTDNVTMTATCATADVTLKYSTDDGANWTNLPNVGATFTETTTAKVKAVKDGYTDSDEATVTYTKIVLDTRTNVTGYAKWDWSKFGTSEIKLTASTTPAKDEEFVLSNATKYGLCASIGGDFGDAQQLCVAGEYVVRESAYFQGPTIKFYPTVAGVLSVKFCSTGTSDSNKRYLAVNNVQYSESMKSTTPITVSNIPIAANTEVVIKGVQNGATADSEAKYLRFYTITFQPTVSANIAASGYTSLASSYALDFANAIKEDEGDAALTAYAISEITKTSVTLTAVEQAPAGEGLILKGTASKTYAIPALASADPITNELDGAVTATAVAASSTYALSGGVLKLFTGTEIPAGKAYLLKSKVPASANELTLDFGEGKEGEVTGIQSVENTQIELLKGDFYNLAGQRVAQPTKGLYIVNGRKVIIK